MTSTSVAQIAPPHFAQVASTAFAQIASSPLTRTASTFDQMAPILFARTRLPTLKSCQPISPTVKQPRQDCQDSWSALTCLRRVKQPRHDCQDPPIRLRPAHVPNGEATATILPRRQICPSMTQIVKQPRQDCQESKYAPHVPNGKITTAKLTRPQVCPLMSQNLMQPRHDCQYQICPPASPMPN